MAEARATLLADADVLIDYVAGGLFILKLTAEHIGPLYLLSQVLDTVDGLSERDCRKTDIQIIEAETAALLEAGSQSGALSFEDWLCVITCRNQQWTCLTNDSSLIRECRGASVPTRRGLSLMVELVRGGVLDRHRALRVAQAIHQANPHHVNGQVLELFRAALDDLRVEASATATPAQASDDRAKPNRTTRP